MQSFLEGPHVSGGSVPVDLLRIARGVAQRQARQHQRGGKNAGSHHVSNNKLSLVVDGECCLDRLYGGYFSGKEHSTMSLFHRSRGKESTEVRITQNKGKERENSFQKLKRSP